MTEKVKNKMPKRGDSAVVNVKIDEKEPEKVNRMTKEKAQALVDAYKKQCESFEVRMNKFKRKEEALKAWVDSFKK